MGFKTGLMNIRHVRLPLGHPQPNEEWIQPQNCSVTFAHSTTRVAAATTIFSNYITHNCWRRIAWRLFGHNKQISYVHRRDTNPGHHNIRRRCTPEPFLTIRWFDFRLPLSLESSIATIIWPQYEKNLAWICTFQLLPKGLTKRDTFVHCC